MSTLAWDEAFQQLWTQAGDVRGMGINPPPMARADQPDQIGADREPIAMTEVAAQ